MTAVDWLDSLSPWPRDGFGLERMRELLGQLGDPQDAYPAIHVVGTNGKSTATVTIEQLLLAEGLSRRLDDLAARRLVERAHPYRRRARPTSRRRSLASARLPSASGRRSSRSSPRPRSRRSQTRVSTPRSSRRGSAVGSMRPTSSARGSSSSPTSGSSTRMSSATRSRRSRPRSSLSRPRTPWSSSPTTRTPHLVPGRELRIGGAREAAEAFVGHPIAADPSVALPGRLEQRDGEIRDGAHNPDGARYLVDRLPAGEYTVVASILARQGRRRDAAGAPARGSRFVATRSSSERALAGSGSRRARSAASSSTSRRSTIRWPRWLAPTSSASRCS